MSNSTMGGESSISAHREWFNVACFGENSTKKFTITGINPQRNIVLNPRFPDTIEVLQNGKPASNFILPV
jgi:hypothetical protein